MAISRERLDYLLSHKLTTIIRLALMEKQISDQDISYLCSSKQASHVLMEMLVGGRLSLKEADMDELFKNYSKLYARDPDARRRRFFEMYANAKHLSEDEVKLQSAKELVLERMPKDHVLGSWCGVYVKGSSDKFIWATITRDSGGFKMTTAYGRVGSKPQGSNEKTFSRMEEALVEMDKYKRGKIREGYVTVEGSSFQGTQPQPPEGASGSSKSEEGGKEEEVEVKGIQQINEDHVQPGNLFHMPEPEPFDFSSATWTKLVQRFAPAGKHADTELGEILKAVSFMEFRAKTSDDWPTADESDDDLEDSFSTEAIGFLFSMFNEADADLIALLTSKSKQEWLMRLQAIKRNVLTSDLEALSKKPSPKTFMDESNKESFKEVLEKARSASPLQTEEEEEEVEIEPAEEEE